MSDEVAPALALHGITKRFGKVTAVDAATMIVRPGTIHALLGENGAGKTTLMRIAYGLEHAEHGRVERHGRPLLVRSPRDAIAAGIGMVHQHFSLVPAMSVAENVALGGHGRLGTAAAESRVRAIGDATGLTIDPRARVADLAVGAQQRVEIIKAFAHHASLLILDEPTAVLVPDEARELLARLRAFAEAGNAVVLITHKLREVLDAADDITVLRRGRTVFTGGARTATEAALVEAMVGVHSPAAPTAAPPAVSPDIVFRLDHVTATDERGVTRLRDASLVVHANEIVGIAGVEGSGHRELLRVLAGRHVPLSGEVHRPTDVGFVPEDRHRDALILDFTLAENLALVGAGGRHGLLRWPALRAATRTLMTQYDVRAPGPDARTTSLSGGNQQRFVVGRELGASPRALVAENPSRGLDVKATAAVHDHLRAARDRGAAVVFYTSDLDELLALADRALVCFGGSVREVPLNLPDVGHAMVGAPP